MPIIDSKVTALRSAFDRSFALPPPGAAAAFEDLLTIRLGGDPFAIRLSAIAELVAGRKVVPIPAATPHLMGLAGIRGGIVPVFGLASILGYGADSAAPRWLLLCEAPEPIVFAFSDFEGHLRLPKTSLHDDESLRSTRTYVHQIATTESGVRAILDFPLVIATILDRSGPEGPTKER